MEENKGCYNCLFEDKKEHEPPCKDCINSAAPCSPEFLSKPFLWKPKGEAVEHPAHYNQGKYECIDVMVDVFGAEATSNFCILNAFKYLWRSKEKNGCEDIKKAIWYLNKHLELEGDY